MGDRNWRVLRCRREGWPQVSSGQGDRRGRGSPCSYTAEEERPVQVRWRAEHEAQEEASPSSSQGRQPFYKRAMRFQGQASVSDGARAAYEEVQGDGQLSALFTVRHRLSAASKMVLVGGLTAPVQEHLYQGPALHRC